MLKYNYGILHFTQFSLGFAQKRHQNQIISAKLTSAWHLDETSEKTAQFYIFLQISIVFRGKLVNIHLGILILWAQEPRKSDHFCFTEIDLWSFSVS